MRVVEFFANLIAQDINMNISGNLLLKSRQNLSESDSYNIGMNLGISGGQSAITPPAEGQPTPTLANATYRNSLEGGVNGFARPSSRLSKAKQDGGQNSLKGYFEQITGEARLSPGNNNYFSIGDSFQSRAFVDQASSIVGINSVKINVGTKDLNNPDPSQKNNYLQGTGNTNIVGAIIANITNFEVNDSRYIKNFINFK